MHARHQVLAAAFGHQPAQVVEMARAHGQARAQRSVERSGHAEDVGRAEPGLIAASAVTYGKERNL